MKNKVRTDSKVRFITGDNYGRKAWWYLRVSKLKWPLYEKAIKNGNSLNLAQFGNILKSGWGAFPPQAIRDEMEELFGVKIQA